nr:MAG TPA: hypothetical protein [Caudoviricetes sp.]
MRLSHFMFKDKFSYPFVFDIFILKPICIKNN